MEFRRGCRRTIVLHRFQNASVVSVVQCEIVIQREFAIKNGHDSLRSFKSPKSINAQNPPRHIRYSITDVTMAHVRSDQLFAFFNDHLERHIVIVRFSSTILWRGRQTQDCNFARAKVNNSRQNPVIRKQTYATTAYRVKNRTEWSARYQTTPGTVRVFIASIWEIQHSVDVPMKSANFGR